MESTTVDLPAGALPGVTGALPDVGAATMTDAELTAALARAFEARRAIDARILSLAGEVAERSRPSLGPGGLAHRSGCTSAPALVAEIARIPTAEASKLCRLGAATAPRLSFTGEWMPPLFPQVAAALAAAELSIESASAIVTTLSTASPRADLTHLDAAERCLVEFAAEHPTDPVRKLAIQWRDALDPDGIEPREAELVERRSLKRFLLANGMKRYVLELDPLSAGCPSTGLRCAPHPGSSRRRGRSPRPRDVTEAVQQGPTSGPRGTGWRLRLGGLRAPAQLYGSPPHRVVVPRQTHGPQQRSTPVLTTSSRDSPGRLAGGGARQRAVVHPALLGGCAAPTAERRTSASRCRTGGLTPTVRKALSGGRPVAGSVGT